MLKTRKSVENKGKGRQQEINNTSTEPTAVKHESKTSTHININIRKIVDIVSDQYALLTAVVISLMISDRVGSSFMFFSARVMELRTVA